MNLKKLPLLLFISLVSFKIYAQDLHFSQFYVLPSYLNPAYVGKFRTDYRVGLVHRRQWLQLNTPYITSGATAEINFRVGKQKYNSIGIGLAVLSDDAGDGIYKANYAIGTVSYQYYLDEFLRHRISGGIQLGYVNKVADISNQLFGSQYSGFGFDRQLSNNESQNNYRLSYVNVSVGVAYNFKINKKVEIEAGVGLFNASRPREGVGNSNLPMRYVFNALVSYRFSQKTSVTPQLLYIRQASSQNFAVGALLGYHLNVTNSPIIYLGSFYRLGESIIPTVAVSYANFYAGFSYDYAIEGINSILKDNPNFNRSNLGSIEFTLVYQGFLSRNLPGKLTVPCGIL